MASYGYARVSSLDQNLGIQRAALKAAGCDVIRAEKASGTRRDGRTELQVLLDFLRPGDALIVTRIDRRRWSGSVGAGAPRPARQNALHALQLSALTEL
jgi:DNA invertase Pin-like site-specific DNA recombinase